MVFVQIAVNQPLMVMHSTNAAIHQQNAKLVVGHHVTKAVKKINKKDLENRNTLLIFVL